MTNGVPAMCSHYPSTYESVKYIPQRLLISLIQPADPYVSSDFKQRWGWLAIFCEKVPGHRPRPWTWLALIKTKLDMPSLSPSQQETQKEADLFNTVNQLWNISEMMSAGYILVWATHKNWNVISLCVGGRLFVQCLWMCLPIARPLSSQVPWGIVGES